MINRIFIILLLAVFGSVLTFAAQTDLSLKARITLRNSIFEILNEPGKSQFKSEEKIFAKLELINESSEEIGMITGQQWRYLQPRLERNGKVVPYKAEIRNILHEDDPVHSPVVYFTLKPKVPTHTDNIQLDYWYGKLEPGHYALNVSRLWIKQTFISNEVEFDIIS